MAPIDATSGALFDGCVISSMLYGISCAQVIRYYRTYADDSRKLKAVVGFVWLMDTLQQCLIAHAAWYYASSKCDSQSLEGCLTWNWSVLAEAVPSIIAIFIVECFFIARIWKFGRKKSALILFVPAAVAPIFATAFLIANWANPSFFVYGAHFKTAEWLTCVASGSYALTDLGIAGTLCYFLYSSRKDAQANSRSLLSKLINYAIATGLLTSVVMCLYLITFVAFAGKMIFLGVYFVGTKVYVNSMLAALNNRVHLRETFDRAYDSDTY